MIQIMAIRIAEAVDPATMIQRTGYDFFSAGKALFTMNL
jgi:hypothetical protein